MNISERKKENAVIKHADITIMRIMATLAVILIHTCNTLTNNAESYSFVRSQFFVLSSIVCLMNWAVPVFFMISGTLLIKEDKNVTYDLVLNKYCKRILLALFVFGIPFSMLELFFNERTLSLNMIPKAILNVLTGNSWGHLWYLYEVLGLYLILPVINAAFSKIDRKNLIIFLLFLFVFSFFVPIANGTLNMKFAFTLPITSYALFYFIVGKLLYEHQSTLFTRRNVIFVFICLNLVMLYLNYKGAGKFLGYDSPIIAGISICVFLLIRGLKLNVNEKIWKFDRLCFGVYLIHPVFVNFMYKFVKITPLNFGTIYIVGVLVLWIIFILLSFIASYIMSLIKPLKTHIL